MTFAGHNSQVSSKDGRQQPNKLILSENVLEYFSLSSPKSTKQILPTKNSDKPMDSMKVN